MGREVINYNDALPRWAKVVICVPFALMIAGISYGIYSITSNDSDVVSPCLSVYEVMDQLSSDAYSNGIVRVEGEFGLEKLAK